MATLHQVMTVPAFARGLFEGVASLPDLQRMGDFGLGEITGLGGELTAYAGRFYKATTEGFSEVTATDRYCYAMISEAPCGPFHEAPAGMTEKTAPDHLLPLFGTANAFQSLLIEGFWDSVITQAFEKVSPPYHPHEGPNQPKRIFVHERIQGFLVGYYTPPHFKSVATGGLHLHFLAADRSSGGHVNSFQLAHGRFAFARLDEIRFIQATTKAFDEASL